jgi:hypothetical protein
MGVVCLSASFVLAYKLFRLYYKSEVVSTSSSELNIDLVPAVGFDPTTSLL